MSAWFTCPYCEEFFEEGSEEHKHVNGRVGHIDNWSPDEDYYYCPHCHEDITDDFNEIGIEEVLERVEYYKDLAERMMGVGRRAVANLGDARNPSTLAYAYREELNELERKL